MKIKTLTLMTFLAITVLPSLSYASPKVTSREYKVFLDPIHFSYGNEASNINRYFSAAKTAIENSITRNVTGAMSFDTQREIRFYDTQGSCTLKNMGYSFRERIENGKKEVTLKYRGYDHYITDFKDLTSHVSGAKTKLEDDITRKDNLGFVVVSSKSTTVPTSRSINDFEDINTLFAGFKNDYDLSNNRALNQVSGLTIYERKYAGATIDLGEFDADLELSLWYTQMPYANLNPVIAEISFKYSDQNANFTQKVVNRAALSFGALKGLAQYNAPTSTATKTQFVYQYQANFCN
ncbi:hypothetical protein [Acinetobacter sp.]|uniref:hypothetical protein n=1 Tax=Acinetobacter sp. TaxID=472 RepID=UPI00388DF170